MSKILSGLFQKYFAEAIVGVLLTTCLVGGAKYLLFDYHKDIQKIDELNQSLNFVELTEEENRFCHMGEIVKNRWDIREENLAPMSHLMISLAQNLKKNRVKEFTPTDSLNSCMDYILKLTAEREEIASTTFHDQKYETLRKSILEWYDAKIQAFKTVSELLIQWDRISLKERDHYLAAIQESIYRSLSILKRVSFSLNNLLQHNEQKKAVVESKIEGCHSEIQLIKLKIILSYAGVIIGITSVILFSILILRRKLSK